MEEMMAKTTPKVRDRQLFCYPDPKPVCTLDSPAWFAWLETATSFRYFSWQRRNVFRGHGPLFAPVSFRKERRRQGWLWYAYRRVHPVLHKRYVGKSDGLTVVKLEETAVLLNEIW
jgi:hypothetical protein